MTSREKINELVERIRKQLTPLIDGDYVLYGLPYHSNIGDTLIWEGELSFLKTLPYRCLDVCGWNSYPQEPLKNKDSIILIHGGGYLGDVWRQGWEYVLDFILKNYGHKIVMFPNTVHYADKSLAAKDAEILNLCSDLTICVRDQHSLELLNEYFPKVNTLLVPDMAFCIDRDYLKKWEEEPSGRTLLLKRMDKELSKTPIPDAIMAQNPDIHDWPTMERLSSGQIWFGRIERRLRAAGKRYRAFSGISTKMLDWMYDKMYRPMMTSAGVKFLSPYSKIYTTRLHTMILSVLMAREVGFIDNSYGKLSTFYDTWLNDCETVKPYGQK